MNEISWIYEQSKDFFAKQSDILRYFGLSLLGVEICNKSMWDDELDLVKIGISSHNFYFYLEISFIEEYRQRTDKLAIGPSSEEISLGDYSLAFANHTREEFERNIRRCLQQTSFEKPFANDDDTERVAPSTLEQEGLLGSRKDYDSRSSYLDHYSEVAQDWVEQINSADEELYSSLETIAEALSFIGSGKSLDKIKSETLEVSPIKFDPDVPF